MRSLLCLLSNDIVRETSGKVNTDSSAMSILPMTAYDINVQTGGKVTGFGHFPFFIYNGWTHPFRTFFAN
jgi:hypothetical protein